MKTLTHTMMIACLGGLLAACGADTAAPGTAQLTLQQTASGDLEHCDAAGNCTNLSNPDQCRILEVEIDTRTGRTCERCLADDGTVLRSTCEDTRIACTVVTVPDPDCVVCAHVDGPVVYSSCNPEPPIRCEPRPVPMTSADPSLPPETCEVCYNADGDVVSDRCGKDCSHVSCPAIACAPGYELVYTDADCCGTCVPVDDCSLVRCPDIAVAECPQGTQLVRDPNDCCGYTCKPRDCSFVACPDIAIDCAPGYHLDFSYPNCCGVCVPDDRPDECMSSADCKDGYTCSTENGDCRPAPGCDSATGAACPAVCYGVCRPDGTTCDDPTTTDAASTLPYFECQGEWRDGGFDANGCPIPPVCVCPDGQTSFDGQCYNLCDLVLCIAPPTCESDEEVSFDYPNCCGVCVPREQRQCEATGGRWDENSCGHYSCGEFPLCDAIIPGCDCGPRANFVPGEGCVEDNSCAGGGSCEYDGTTFADGDVFPANDGCNTCTCVDGQAICTLLPCFNCWGAQRTAAGACVGPNGNLYEDSCCEEARLCNSTGGHWDPNSCGDWACGQEPLCDAIIPGCNCGPGKLFDPNRGCYRSDECAAVCEYDGTVRHDSEVWEASDGCNTCTCFGGAVICTEIACNATP